MRKYAAPFSCVFLLILLAQVGNVQAATRSASEVAAIQKEAEQGNAVSQVLLGFMYDSGDGVPKDSAKAAYWFQQAAEQGHAGGQFLTGYCYEQGRGVTQDYARTVQWYQKAAEQGDADAQYRLGRMYAEGKGVPHKNVFEAAKWIQKTAEQGHTEARAFLGVMHITGDGVIRDRQKGCDLIRTSAEQGFPLAIEAYNQLCSAK